METLFYFGVVLLFHLSSAKDGGGGGQCSTFVYQHKIVEAMLSAEKNFTELQESVNARLNAMETFTYSAIDSTSKTSENVTVMSHVAQSLRDDVTGGSTYIRWGKRYCPNDTDAELVYEGFAAGGHYNEKGAGPNYLCLPKDPIYVDDINGLKGTVYGGEYEIKGDVYQHDVPCAVCMSPRTNVLMIPGRNQCYDKWQLEYHGMLVTGNVANEQKEHVCMDSKPDALHAGYSNDNGALFFLITYSCGSLKCPPYINGQEVTCVVCSYRG